MPTQWSVVAAGGQQSLEKAIDEVLRQDAEKAITTGRTIQDTGSHSVASSYLNGVSDATVWGVVLAAWVLIMLPPFLVATGRVPTGKKGDDDWYTRIAWRWIPGLLVLIAGSRLHWHPIACLIGASVIFGAIWFVQAGSRHIRGAALSRTVRAFVAITLLWILLLQFWGFIWNSDAWFSRGQFLALHLMLPALLGIGLAGWKWVRRG